MFGQFIFLKWWGGIEKIHKLSLSALHDFFRFSANSSARYINTNSVYIWVVSRACDAFFRVVR